MMKAADAMSAADRTLREGRNAALRKPSRQSGQFPRPDSGRPSRERSHAENRNRHATSSAAPAPKNIPVCAARETKPPASIASPAAAKTIPMHGRARRAPRAPATGRSMACAVRSARGDNRATARSDTTTQSAAATIPADRPDRERQARHVQLQQRRPDGAAPPRAQAVDDQLAVGDGAEHAERAARGREDERLGQQQPAHVRDREAGGAQDADLPQALLDAEAEEQDGQQQRRHDEEEAEVGEVLAEVGRARRGLDRETPHRRDRDPHRLRLQRLAQILADQIGKRGCVSLRWRP